MRLGFGRATNYPLVVEWTNADSHSKAQSIVNKVEYGYLQIDDKSSRVSIPTCHVWNSPANFVYKLLLTYTSVASIRR